MYRVRFVVVAENEMEMAARSGEETAGVGLCDPLGFEPFQAGILIEERRFLEMLRAAVGFGELDQFPTASRSWT